MRATTETRIETRRGPTVSVEAENEGGVILRIGGALANVSLALTTEEARALSFGIDTAASVVEAGVA